MITLITGVPGSGKTAYALNAMLQHAQENNRPIFVHGIPGLKIAHEPVKCSSQHCDACHTLSDELLKADDWHTWAPDGAILFYDETQNVFRPRSSSSKVPDYVAALEVHRHRGLDFYLITQHPNLIDANVRRLVSKHIHLAGTWLRRISYEWGETASNVQSTTTAVKTTYKIPKKVFPLYQSASLHTKLNRKIPPLLYIMAALLVIFSLGAYRLYHSRIAKPEPTATTLDNGPANLEDPAQKFDFVPTVFNRPESAPAYRQIVKVTDFPKLAGCLYSASRKKCTCYTQQATEYLVTKDECMDVVQHTRFNPYHVDKPNEPNRNQATTTKPNQPNAPGQIPAESKESPAQVVWNSHPSFVQPVENDLDE
ncbi:MAG: zonular occludens toxin domain-containing protein [Methylovulum sp.]|nr:zonular occludens toxin domain-containing protein [Methylovulum sp.]